MTAKNNIGMICWSDAGSRGSKVPSLAVSLRRRVERNNLVKTLLQSEGRNLEHIGLTVAKLV